MTARYLLRLVETGREAQPKRSKTRRDVIAAVYRRVPAASVCAEVGRVVVESETDALAELAMIHGVVSLSPCTLCAIDELEAEVLCAAERALRAGASFRVKVKRVGDHEFSSRELAARLGDQVGQAHPECSVDLDSADVSLGVEIRDRDCYVFTETHPGFDFRTGKPRVATDRPAFLVDHMLGKLKLSLRLLGYDTAYARHEPDSAVARRARVEGRIILTRDRELALSPNVDAVYITRGEPMDQLAEVVDILELSPDERGMFTRCTLCNGEVEAVEKQSVSDALPAEVLELYDEFTRCTPCDKVYWKGGQYERLLGWLASAMP